jgi:hypothetical protein
MCGGLCRYLQLCFDIFVDTRRYAGGEAEFFIAFWGLTHVFLVYLQAFLSIEI